MIEKMFKLSEKGTTIRTEAVAGITTFLSMAYILAVNPDMLSAAGMDQGAVFTATALSAVIGTLIMGLFANYPIALAPGMGMNAFFTFSVVLGLGYAWEDALFAIFISGILFLILAVTGIREMIINAIPSSLKHAVGVGIGFFICFIGFQKSGIIVADPATLVTLGDFSDPQVLLAIFGTLLILVLLAKKVKAAIFIGIIVTAVVGAILGLVDTPTHIVESVPSMEPTLGKVFSAFTFENFTSLSMWTVIFSFLFVDFFDTTGTLLAVGTRAGLINEQGELVDAQKALVADASATVIGTILGTSSVTSYVESTTGVEAGGRTGLTSVFTAACFLIALFFSPLLAVVTSTVTAPALIAVGALMASNSVDIDFSDFAVAVSAFFIMIFMVTAYSIAEGISAGFLSYTLVMVAMKRHKELHPIMYVLTGIFILHYFI